MNAIEKTLICSVLMSDFSPEQKQILEFDLNPDLFTNGFNKLFVKSINRLKELNLPLDEITLHSKLGSVMTIGMENELVEILIMNPLGTIGTFTTYYKMLKDHHDDIRKSKVQL